MAEVSGVTHKLMQGISPGYGYTAIIVAWLAKLNPLGLIITSILFGGLIVGGSAYKRLVYLRPFRKCCRAPSCFS